MRRRHFGRAKSPLRDATASATHCVSTGRRSSYRNRNAVARNRATSIIWQQREIIDAIFYHLCAGYACPPTT